MYPIAKVAVENAALSFDKAYSYLIPEDLALRPGMRVQVPFGRANQRRTALVLEVTTAGNRERMKPVTRLLDQTPILDGEGLKLLHYLREHTFCTYFDALRLLVPAGLSIVHRNRYTAGNLPPQQPLSPTEEELVAYLRKRKVPVDEAALQKRFSLSQDDATLQRLAQEGVLIRQEHSVQAVRDEKIAMVRLLEDWREAPLTPKQKLVYGFLQENETASLREICYYTSATRSVVDALCKKGAVEYYDQPVLRNPFQNTPVELEEAPPLSAEQQEVFHRLAAMTKEEAPAPALLYGVTGSGKTQVYLHLIQTILDQNRTAMVLVPEISLTAQLVDAFHRRFGNQVAVLHSALSLGERMDQWKRIRSGDAPIVVGTRSAVFAPLERLGLIVMDEEQEHTYKSEQSPRFHARDVARLRSAHHGALLLLASATPLVESYHAALKGRYRLVELHERFGDAQLPDVYTVDMRDLENQTEASWLSTTLQQQVQDNLDRGEQSILLLNRRGYSTVIKCSSCGTVADCPNCSVAMTYHSANSSLLCHYCGYQQKAIRTCAHCGSELIRYAGTGTQKLEEELAAQFPGARVLRVDMDTTMAKFSHQKLFGAFARGEYDIMIGTQMVAKGLNFPKVTLVGVLMADQSLYAADFRSFERSFSLLTQVVGRGGRGTRRGRAIIQTYSPDNPIIQLAARQDYPAFFAEEITSRRLHLYPPFCTMVGIGFVGEDLEQVREGSDRFVAQFAKTAKEQYSALPVRLLGPVPSDILKAAGKYRYKLVLKCRDSKETRALLHRTLAWFLQDQRQVHAFVDMYYDRL